MDPRKSEIYCHIIFVYVRPTKDYKVSEQAYTCRKILMASGICFNNISTFELRIFPFGWIWDIFDSSLQNTQYIPYCCISILKICCGKKELTRKAFDKDLELLDIDPLWTIELVSFPLNSPLRTFPTSTYT